MATDRPVETHLPERQIGAAVRAQVSHKTQNLPEKHNTTPQLSEHAGLAMLSENLQSFVAAVRANGQVRYGDVRRLQRDILPNGIFSREEAGLLIALNAGLVRADRAWAQWLMAAVA